MARAIESTSVAREAGGLRRAELRWAFSEQRMSKEWEEQIVQHIVNFAQSGRNSEKPIKV